MRKSWRWLDINKIIPPQLQNFSLKNLKCPGAVSSSSGKDKNKIIKARKKNYAWNPMW